jgi:integrase
LGLERLESAEFMAAYGEALARTSLPSAEVGASRTAPGSIGALVVNYFQSAAWLELPKDTQKNRRHILERFRAEHGDRPAREMRRDHVEWLLNQITAGPATKHYWLLTVRALMQSGIPSILKADPTAGIKVKRPKTEGRWTWQPEEIERYRAHHPLGTEARLVMEFAYQTMSRRGEVVRLGPQHLKRDQNGQLRIKIARIKGSNPVGIPVSPELLAAIESMPKTGLVYVTGENGQPISKITLGHRFAKWCKDSGLPDRCRMHGLKKSGMVDLAVAGATAPQLMAWSGHKDMGVAQKYIEKAFDRPELADAAFEKLMRTKRARE